MTFEDPGSDGLNYSFNLDNKPCQPTVAELSLAKAFFSLVNVEEHPEILPFAFDVVASQLKVNSSEYDLHLPEATEKVEPRKKFEALKNILLTKSKYFDHPWRGGPEGLKHRVMMHFYLQYMPMALVDGCWLQAGTRVATAHTSIGAAITGLYEHQVRGFVSDSGRHFVGDYKDAFSLVGGAIEDVSSHSFCERLDIAQESFELPLFLLALSQFTRTRSPEIIGVNLAWQYLGIPSFGPRLIADFCETYDLPKLDDNLVEPEYLEKGLSLASEAADILLNETMPAHQNQVCERIFGGAKTAFRLLGEWLGATQDAAPSGPVDLRQEMIDLIWRKSTYAKGYHCKRTLGDKAIDDYLNTENFDGPALLDALANSTWVTPGESSKSRIVNHSISIYGPMFAVFSPVEQQIIKEWIDALPPVEENDRPKDLAKVKPDLPDDDIKPTIHSEKNIKGRMWKSDDVRIRSDKMFGNCNVRELYHHLINVEFYPEILPVAEQFARDRLERSIASMWNGERPIPAHKYSPVALDRWVEQKHREQVDSYRPLSARPEVSREVFIEANVKLAPLILIDGGWLQGIASPAIIDTTVGRMLFHIFVEEIGEGNADLHHANIYRDLLAAMGVSAPPVDSLEFINWDRLDTESFDIPTLWLAISCFPRHFMPEILGLNLAVELAGLGGPYMEARDTLRAFRYPTIFVELHNAADNITSGHSGWAVSAIKRYMVEVAEREGPHNVDQVWHRVWSGVRLTLPQIGRFRLLAHRARRRFFGRDPRFVPLIFPKQLELTT